MITPLSIQDCINDFIEENVAPKFLLNSKDNIEDKAPIHPIVIRSGWALPESVGSSEYDGFPYIITRIERVEQLQDTRFRHQCVITLAIIFGVLAGVEYDKNGVIINDGGGYRDFWNLVEAVRQALFSQGTIAKRFRIMDDYFEAEMFDEQVRPYWEGFCLTKWHVALPVRQSDTDFFGKEISNERD